MGYNRDGYGQSFSQGKCMIIIDWGNYEETLLVVKFEDKWSLAKQLEAMDIAYKLVRSKTEAVVLMIDMQRALKMPPGFSHAIYQYARMEPENLYASIIISQSPVWKKLYEATTYLYGSLPDVRHTFVNNADGAYDVAEIYLATCNNR